MLPTPYAYVDYRRFLADWFLAKKGQNPRFSHRLFARMSGQKNPSLLHHVIGGQRNLTRESVESFVQGLGLRTGEAQFFRLLVTFEQARDAAERNRAWDQISATRRFREARPIEREAFEYLASWTLPAIRELARRSDFRPDPAWIAAQLCPPISPPEARRALDVLQQLGLLVPSGDTLVSAEASVATAPEVSQLAVTSYYRSILGLAAEAIERFPGTERQLLSVTVGAPADLLPTIKAEATAFMERMMHLCDQSPAPPVQVLSLNFQIFPLTGPPQETPR